MISQYEASMDIVRIKLIKPNSFWFLNDLHLGPGNSISPPFDLDEADPKIREKIVKAEDTFGIIKIVRQSKDTKPSFNINQDSSKRFELPQTSPMAIKTLDGQKVATPIPPVKDKGQEEMPELKSFTVEPEPEPKEELPEPTEQDYKNAEVLLARNGNTIKKTVRSLDRTSTETVSFLLACIKKETSGKDREGILESLRNALAEATR
jgi:hypothetical protein